MHEKKMTDNVRSELIQRKGKEEIHNDTEIEKEAKQITKDNDEVETTWETIKYYFNRFRYYHFIVADTIDKYASAACLWILNMYFRLFLGVGPDLPSTFDDEDIG